MKKKTRREKLGWDGSQGYCSEALMHHPLPRKRLTRKQKIERQLKEHVKTELWKLIVKASNDIKSHENY